MFRRIIKIELAIQGLSVRQLCKIAGIRRPQTITDWLSGRKGLSVDNLERLLEALGIEDLKPVYESV